MDRISRALELARQNRDSIMQSPVQGAPSRSSVAEVDPSANIVYSRTKRIAVDREVLRKNRIVTAYLDDPVADAYRLLRTRVLRVMRQNGWKTIGVTSAQPGDGKTLTAINLGLMIALEQNHTVMLVDTDLRRPTVSKRFGLDPEQGLADCLADGVPVEDVLINPGIDRFVLLPSAGSVRGSSELLASRVMSDLMTDLASRYSSRLVIFDLPPVLIADDVVGISSLVDAVLLVVEDGKTDSEQLRRSLQLLEGVEVLGTVLNKSESHSEGHYYTYD